MSEGTDPAAAGLQSLLVLAAAEAPNLVTGLVAYAQQETPWQDRETAPGYLDLDGLRRALAQARGARSKRDRQQRAHEVWKRYLTQPDGTAPQLALADVVVRLYETPGGPARRALLALVAEAPLVFGLWGGLKRVYKRAEADLDAQVFGAFAARIDAELRMPSAGDVSRGTLVYLGHRAWRLLRQLGKSVPELYPSFAVELLRNWPEGHSASYGSAGYRILHHSAPKWGYDKNPIKGRKFQAPYADAWARSPDPLLLLLETCRSDAAASFALFGLRELFPSVLRGFGPDVLARLCLRPLASAHELVVEILEGAPEYHAGKLRELGMHDAVLALLRSPSKRARTYAIDYARGHASALETSFLVELLEGEHDDVVKFAAALVVGRPARQVGLPMIVRLLRYPASRKWAQTALENEFEPHEIPHALLGDLALTDENSRWVRAWLKKRFGAGTLSPGFWIGLLSDPRLDDAAWDTRGWILEQLGAFPIQSLPAEWVLSALLDAELVHEVSAWLEKASALPAGIDADRLKGLVFDPSTRDVALKLLGNPKIFRVEQVGVDWFLALARRADPSLSAPAHRYVLQHVCPQHIGGGDARAAAQRMFGLAVDNNDPIRTLAQAWLLCHHPKLGRQQPESRELGIKPLLPRDVYTLAQVWPLLWDARPDVRRFAVTITRAEFARWKEPNRVYELAESPAREVRNVAYDALQQAGDARADADLALSVDDLDAAMVFSMTESTIGSTREVAMSLIRKHYPRLGGAERLGWLMQSADREVRLFAVRLLWEKHRPRSTPAGWKPRGKHVAVAETTPFLDDEALRGLLRRMLFSVPPARGGEKGERRTGAKLPANAAKRRIVEVVRDFGIRDREFAVLVAPVLAEFTGSVAKGEWQTCLSALLALRAAHDLPVEGLI